MPAKPSDLERVEHMVKAINKIFNYTESLEYVAFFKSELVQDAVMKNFEVLGEAAYHISKELKEDYEEVEWKKIEGLRHVLVHEYYKVNPAILWNTKEEYLHELQTNLEVILTEKSSEEEIDEEG